MSGSSYLPHCRLNCVIIRWMDSGGYHDWRIGEPVLVWRMIWDWEKRYKPLLWCSAEGRKVLLWLSLLHPYCLTGRVKSTVLLLRLLAGCYMTAAVIGSKWYRRQVIMIYCLLLMDCWMRRLYCWARSSGMSSCWTKPIQLRIKTPKCPRRRCNSTVNSVCCWPELPYRTI